MKIVLHVGPHKTGTTSLQSMLGRHSETLTDMGFFVPKIKNLDGSPNNWYLIFASSATPERLATYHNSIRGGHKVEDCENFQRAYQQQVRKELQRGLALERDSSAPVTVLFSTEEIAFLNQDEVNSLYHLFSEYVEEIKVVYYYRSPFSRLRSDLQQGSKGGFVHDVAHLHRIGPQDELRIKKLVPEENYQNQVTIYVRPYKRDIQHFKDWDVRNDFNEFLNLGLSDKIKEDDRPDRNDGMSLQMFTVLQGLNRLMPTNGPNQEFNQFRRHLHHAIEAYKWTKLDTPFKLSKNDLKILMQRRSDYRNFIGFCADHPCIHVDEECSLVDQHFEQDGESYDASIPDSAFNYEPDLPRVYYINLIAHFWSYLRRIDMAQHAAKRSN